MSTHAGKSHPGSKAYIGDIRIPHTYPNSPSLALRGPSRHESTPASAPRTPYPRVQLFGGSQAWMVTKYKDVCSAVGSDRLSKERSRPGFPELHEGGKRKSEKKPTFVNMDDPLHREQRNMGESLFTPEHVEKMRPLIQKTVDSILDSLVKGGDTSQSEIGCEIKAGEGVIASNQSANHDEEVFPDPDKLDIHRKNADANLRFGYGPRRCLGEWLSRAELEVVFGMGLPFLSLPRPIRASELRYTSPTKDFGIVEFPVYF